MATAVYRLAGETYFRASYIIILKGGVWHSVLCMLTSMHTQENNIQSSETILCSHEEEDGQLQISISTIIPLSTLCKTCDKTTMTLSMA